MSQPTGSENRNWIPIIIWSVVGILMLIFVINNSQRIDVNFAFTETTWPLWLLMLFIFALGAAAGWATRWWNNRR